MTNRRVLVTGGAGFIGSNIVAHHLAKGDEVWAVDNLQTGRKSNLEPFFTNPSFKFDESNLLSWKKIHEAANWADRIYHMAADVGQRFVIAHPIGTLSDNISCYEQLLKALAETKSQARLILASTSELYNYCARTSDIGFPEETPITIPSGKFIQETYPVGKITNEVMTLAYNHEKGLHCTIARIFNTVGLNQSSAYGMVLPKFIEQALKNEPIAVYGDGLQTRSFSNVHDTVAMLELLLENESSVGEIYNVGSDIECSIVDLAKKVIQRTESKSKIVYVDYKEAYGIDFVDVRHRRANLEKLRKLINYAPKWTLDQTIDELISAQRSKV
jgi:UDP-glucose 4-epimerase